MHSTNGIAFPRLPVVKQCPPSNNLRASEFRCWGRGNCRQPGRTFGARHSQTFVSPSNVRVSSWRQVRQRDAFRLASRIVKLRWSQLPRILSTLGDGAILPARPPRPFRHSVPDNRTGSFSRSKPMANRIPRRLSQAPRFVIHICPAGFTNAGIGEGPLSDWRTFPIHTGLIPNALLPLFTIIQQRASRSPEE